MVENNDKEWVLRQRGLITKSMPDHAIGTEEEAASREQRWYRLLKAEVRNQHFVMTDPDSYLRHFFVDLVDDLPEHPRHEAPRRQRLPRPGFQSPNGMNGCGHTGWTVPRTASRFASHHPVGPSLPRFRLLRRLSGIT